MNQKIFNVASLVVAVSALGLSLWQGYVQRQHNHVSLEPRINAYFQSNEGLGVTGLYVINNGLGPGYVEEIKIYVDGELIARSGQDQVWVFSSALKPLGVSSQSCIAVAGPRPNDSLKVGEEIQLITLGKGSIHECLLARLELLQTDWSRLDFTFAVRSIYGDRFIYRYKGNEQVAQ